MVSRPVAMARITWAALASALLADLCVEPGDPPAGPLAAVGALLAGGKRPLGSFEAAKRPGEGRGVGDQVDGALVVGHGGKDGDADVDAGGPAGRREPLDR